MLGSLADANDGERIRRLKQQAALGASVPGLRAEASAHRTDTVSLHPKLSVDGAKSLLCVSFQVSAAVRNW
jgi:hypothetical protein